MDGQNFNNQQPVFQQPVGVQPGGEDKPNGMSIAALVLGICSIVVGCCSGLVGLILGIIGVVLGILGNKSNKTKLGTAGLIVAIVGSVWSIASWGFAIWALNKADSWVNDLLKSYQ